MQEVRRQREVDVHHRDALEAELVAQLALREQLVIDRVAGAGAEAKDESSGVIRIVPASSGSMMIE